MSTTSLCSKSDLKSFLLWSYYSDWAREIVEETWLWKFAGPNFYWFAVWRYLLRRLLFVSHTWRWFVHKGNWKRIVWRRYSPEFCCLFWYLLRFIEESCWRSPLMRLKLRQFYCFHDLSGRIFSIVQWIPLNLGLLWHSNSWCFQSTPDESLHCS